MVFRRRRTHPSAPSVNNCRPASCLPWNKLRSRERAILRWPAPLDHQSGYGLLCLAHQHNQLPASVKDLMNYSSMPIVCCSSLCEIHRRINVVLLQAIVGITLSERSEQLEILHNRHCRSCDGCISFYCAVWIKKYAERYLIENKGPRKTALDHLWSNNGFRINVEVCCYARLSLALLWMKHVAYLDIYKRPSKIRTTEITCEG